MRRVVARELVPGAGPEVEETGACEPQIRKDDSRV